MFEWPKIIGQFVRQGDSITIDPLGMLQLNVPTEELTRRFKEWNPPQRRYKDDVLAKYAKLVLSVNLGAATDLT